MSASPSPAPHRPRPRHACPLRAAEDALLLLASGRVDMARVVLEGLPALLRQAERERLLAENEDLRGRVGRAEAALARSRDLEARLARTARELADLKAALGVTRRTPAKPLAKPHERLATALADGKVTARRVAAALKAEPRHVYEVATGKVGLSSTYWRRVLALLETDAT